MKRALLAGSALALLVAACGSLGAQQPAPAPNHTTIVSTPSDSGPIVLLVVVFFVALIAVAVAVWIGQTLRQERRAKYGPAPAGADLDQITAAVAARLQQRPVVMSADQYRALTASTEQVRQDPR